MTKDHGDVLSSRADVPTDAPARYAKQLVSHLGRKVDFVTEGTTYTATIGDATAQIAVGDGVLTLLATATAEEDLNRIEHALGSHLRRFGRRAELAVRWERRAPEAGPASVG